MRIPDMDLQDSPRWPPVASERRQPSLLESSYSLYMTCFSSFVPPSPAACPPACGQPPIIPCCPLASSLPCGFSYSPSPSGHTPALPWAPHPLSISPLTPRTRIWQSQPHFLDGHLRQKPAGHSPCRAAPLLQPPRCVVLLPMLLLCFLFSQRPGCAE